MVNGERREEFRWAFSSQLNVCSSNALYILYFERWERGESPGRHVVDITAIHGVNRRPLYGLRALRRKGCISESNIPSPHGGRGALPSEGGSPSDLLFLAGGGSSLFLIH
nr:hypothetical protein Pyn_02918 [Ipomoea batatas]